MTSGRIFLVNLVTIKMSANEYNISPMHMTFRPNGIVANSIANATNFFIISDFKEYEGYGVCAKIDGDEVLVGNEKLLQKFKIK